MIDYIFGILGLLAIVVAVSACRAGTRSDREIEKVVNAQKIKDNESNLQR